MTLSKGLEITYIIIFVLQCLAGAKHLKTDILQASAFEVCDCMCAPLHMPKTLQTCKRKLIFFD